MGQQKLLFPYKQPKVKEIIIPYKDFINKKISQLINYLHVYSNNLIMENLKNVITLIDTNNKKYNLYFLENKIPISKIKEKLDEGMTPILYADRENFYVEKRPYSLKYYTDRGYTIIKTSKLEREIIENRDNQIVYFKPMIDKDNNKKLVETLSEPGHFDYSYMPDKVFKFTSYENNLSKKHAKLHPLSETYYYIFKEEDVNCLLDIFNNPISKRYASIFNSLKTR